MSNPPGPCGKSIYNSKDLKISRGTGGQYYDYRAGTNSTTADQLHARGALGIGSSVAPQGASDTQGGVSYHDFLTMISQAKTSTATSSQLDAPTRSEPRVSVLSAKPTPLSPLQPSTRISPSLSSPSSLSGVSPVIPSSIPQQQITPSRIQSADSGMKTSSSTPSTFPTAAVTAHSGFPSSVSYPRDPSQAPFLDSSTVASLVYGKKKPNSKPPPSSLLDTINPLDERSVIAQLKEEMALEKCQVPDSIVLAAKQQACLSPEDRLHQRYGVTNDALDLRPDDFNEETAVDDEQVHDGIASGANINTGGSIPSKEKKGREQGEHYDQVHEDLESRRLRIERVGKEHLQPKPSLLTLEERLLALHAGPSSASSSAPLVSKCEALNDKKHTNLETSSDELDAELEKLLEQTELEMEKEVGRDSASDSSQTPSHHGAAEKDLQANISAIYSELQSVGIKPGSFIGTNNGAESEENVDDDDDDDDDDDGDDSYDDGDGDGDGDKVGIDENNRVHSTSVLSVSDKGVYYDPSTNKLVVDGSSTQAQRLHQARQAHKGEKSREVRDIISFVFDEVAVEEELEKANENHSGVPPPSSTPKK